MTPHRITIDMKKSGYKQFVNIRQSENESHIIYISLTNGTEPIKLDNDMVATVYLEGISKQWESCDIKDNEIVFTAPILNVGDTKCQIQLSNNNGYSISPTFIIVVENILNVPHFELLEEEPDDWVDNADSYYTFNGIDYVPVKFSSDRNLLTNLEFKTNDHSAGSIVYKRSQAISVSQGRKIYCTTTSNMLSITLKFEYKIGDNLSGNITTKEVDCKAQMRIVTPTITKRQYLENGYTDVVMSVVADSSYIDDNYKLTNTMLEYDEKTYINCNTPYFEKGKYYAMVNDYGNVGNSYNALIQALQEARTYYNKAIKEVSMIDNCLVITYNDNTQYKSGDLKGDGITRLDKSTDGNVDTYTFVTDKGNTFSFTVTNADNTKIEDLYTQLGYKTPLTVFNNEVVNIKELINDLDTKKESIEEHNKSISQLKNSLSIINTQLSILNNNKVEKDTYTTAIESLQSLVTKLQNSKVDTNTYNDEIANLTTAISELNDKQIDTNAIKESITELDTNKLNKEEYNQYKENVANTFANTDNNIKTNKTSIESLSKDFNTYKTATDKAIAEIESLKSGKLDKADFNSYKTSNDNAVNSKVDTTDFNAYKSATDTDISKCVTDIANNSALISKNQINVTTDKSTSIVLNDSSDCNIVGLTLYGNSMQSAVPTPTAPANIDNVTNPQIKLYRKNLFDFKIAVFNENANAKITKIDRENRTVSFVTSATNDSSGIYIRNKDGNFGTNLLLLQNKKLTLSFDIVADKEIPFLASFMKSNWNVPKTVNTAKQRLSVTDTADNIINSMTFYVNKQEANITISNIQIEVNNTATDYEVCDVKQVSADCTLCKVNNIADTLTVNADGTGYITQNLLYERIKSGSSQSGHIWKYSTTTKRFYRDDTRYKANAGTPNLLCSHFEVKDNERDVTLDNSIGFTSGTGEGVAIRMLQFDGDISAFENWLDNNEVYILLPLKQPIITELSKEQVDKILSLHTYYPSTTVISDSDFVLTYVADTKCYIDNKFNELATALVAHESEVN